MAPRSKLTVQSLAKLGAPRLAEILIAEAARNRQLKQTVQMALAAETGSVEVASQVRKRLATLARSHAFVSHEKARELRAELEQLQAVIVDTIGDKNPKLAADLLWQYLDLHASVFDRSDDSSGRIGDIFRVACKHIGALTKRAKSKPQDLAGIAFEKVTNNDYSIYDGLIVSLSDALGKDGRAALRALLKQRRALHLTSDARVAIASGRFDYTLSGLSLALRDLADCEGDADAFIETYQERDLANPAFATEIALRLLRAGRPEEALAALDRARPSVSNRHFHELEWTDARIAAMDALGRSEEAQTLRYALFERYLSAPHLKAYLKGLPDFDDVEAESKALDHVERHRNVHAALAFLINWPALERAARVVLSRVKEVNGDLYELLDPAASVLEGKHALAAVLLRRSLIEVSLQKGRATRYKHAARHIREIDSQQAEIKDYGNHATHAEFMAELRRDHGRKTSFWSLLEG